MTQICKDVGWDGESFYCQRCGRAGFRSEASARGHLSQCRGRAIERGVFPTPVEMLPRPPGSGCCEQVVLPPAGGGGAGTYHAFSGGGGGGGGGGGENTIHTLGGFGGTSPPFSPDPLGYPDYVGQQLAVHASQIAELSNEYNHMLIARNQPVARGQDWFSRYKGLIVIGAIVLFAMMLSERSKNCPSASDATGKSAPDIGQKALAKLVDVSITKGVGALLK